MTTQYEDVFSNSDHATTAPTAEPTPKSSAKETKPATSKDVANALDVVARKKAAVKKAETDLITADEKLAEAKNALKEAKKAAKEARKNLKAANYSLCSAKKRAKELFNSAC